MNWAAYVIPAFAQLLMTSVIGWLVHKLTQARTEFRRFMNEHEQLIRAVLKLNKRLDRLERKVNKK